MMHKHGGGLRDRELSGLVHGATRPRRRDSHSATACLLRLALWGIFQVFQIGAGSDGRGSGM